MICSISAVGPERGHAGPGAAPRSVWRCLAVQKQIENRFRLWRLSVVSAERLVPHLVHRDSIANRGRRLPAGARFGKGLPRSGGVSSQVATIFAKREHMVFVFHNNCSLWMKLYCLHIQLLSQRDSRPGRAQTTTLVTRGSL